MWNAPPYTKKDSARSKLHLSLWRMMWLQLLDFWPIYILALCFLVATHLIQVQLPFLAKDLADLVSGDRDSINTHLFYLLAIGILVFRTASRLFFFYPARVLERNMRVDLLRKLEDTPPARYRNFPNGDIFQVVYGDTEQIRALIGFALLQIGNVGIGLAVILPKLASFNPKLLMALIPLVIAFVLFTVIVAQTRHYHRKAMDLTAMTQNFIMETYSAKKTIKNYQSEKDFIDLFKKNSWEELVNNYKAGIGVAFSIPLIPLGVGASLLWGAHLIYSLDLGASSLVLFSGFVFLFMEPLAFLSWIGIVFASSLASWGRLRKLVDVLDSISEVEKQLDHINGESGGTCVLFWDKELELNMKEGSWSVLVGATGCGKTEVMLQLANLHKKAGNAISYVAQSPYLYNDTIENNIFLGNVPTGEQRQRAWEYLEMMGLTYLAPDRESLLAMEVGEHGKRLSGGQAKRVCLVRSLMSDADIILWDDPFSSVDVIHEKDIFQKLKNDGHLKGKTFVLTSHRISTVRNSDYLIYLEKERGILEEGNAGQLLEEGNKTHVFFEKQLV